MSRVRAFLGRVMLTDWLALGLLLLYVFVFSWLTIRQHQSFNTNALDLAKFDQAIWNTANGRPYQITIAEDSVLQSHFSPALALFAPLYWLWPDVRFLFIVQSLLLGGAGFLIYWYLRRERAWLGVVVLGAYLMHPLLHQVNLVEFRRNTLAVFAISFALYHLLRRRYGWMLLGLLLALLSKEDMSLVAIAFGLYILLFQRQMKAGAVTLGLGAAWLLIVPFVLLPALMPHDAIEGYQHADAYFAYLGDTPGEMVQTVVGDPLLLLGYAGQPQRLTAVFKFLWPTAFLFLLAPDILFLLLPNLAFLLISTSEAQGRLEGWYPAVLLIILYWAVGVGVARLPRRWQKWAAAALLLAGALAWLLNSQLWPGARFDAARYEVTAHERQVEGALRAIPADAIVMAQDPLAPHLAHRQDIYLFPWVRGGNQPDYVAFDRAMRTYPLGPDEYRSRFYDVFASTEYALTQQIDSFYLFEFVGADAPQQPLEALYGDALRLQGISTAAALPQAAFRDDARELLAGSTLRVALYWEVVAPMEQNYTAFVHAAAPDGRTLAQHDSWPADTHRPTSVLPAGEQFRDVHYLTFAEPVNLDDLQLRIGLYDANGTPLFLEEERPFLLTPVP